MSAPDTLASASVDRALIADMLEAAIAEVRKEQESIRAELKINTETTAKIKDLTEEMVDLFTAAKGAFKVLGWFGTLVKWIGGIAIACAGLWGLWTNSGMPPK
jgi:hypothetical protein